jgi:hypothetical protein
MAKKAAEFKIVTNKSDAIRELFHAKGDVSSGVILDELAQHGVQCSVTLIESIRKKMKQAKTLTVATAAKKAAPTRHAPTINQIIRDAEKAAAAKKAEAPAKKPAAKKKAAKAVTLPPIKAVKPATIKPGTIAFEVSSVWYGLYWCGFPQDDTVASLKEWLEQEAGDIQDALDLLGQYDDDANPWTTKAG